MKFKEYVKEERVDEAVFEPVDLSKAIELSKAGKEKEAEALYRKWDQHFKTMYNTINTLTGMTGGWYVGKTKNEMRDKLEAMSTDQIKGLRDTMAQLAKKLKMATKLQNEVKKDAKDLINNFFK